MREIRVEDKRHLAHDDNIHLAPPFLTNTMIRPLTSVVNMTCFRNNIRDFDGKIDMSAVSQTPSYCERLDNTYLHDNTVISTRFLLTLTKDVNNIFKLLFLIIIFYLFLFFSNCFSNEFLLFLAFVFILFG